MDDPSEAPAPRTRWRRPRVMVPLAAAAILAIAVVAFSRGDSDAQRRTSTRDAPTSSSSSGAPTIDTVAVSSGSSASAGTQTSTGAASSGDATTSTTIDDGSLRVELTGMSPAHPSSGEEVAFTFAVHHAVRYDEVQILDARSYGTFWFADKSVGAPNDGAAYDANGEYIFHPCSEPREPMPDPTSVTFHERFRVASQQHYVVRVLPHCDSGVASFLNLDFDVSGPAVTYNGPGLPHIQVDQASPDAQGQDGDTTAVHLFVAAQDGDGDVSAVVIDWGDGTAAEAMDASQVEKHACDTTTEWNDAAGVSSYVGSPKHVYATPGTYTVTVTATSVGCDGAGAQQSTKALDVRFPY